MPGGRLQAARRKCEPTPEPSVLRAVTGAVDKAAAAPDPAIWLRSIVPWLNPESRPFPIDGRELIVANNA